MFDKMRENLPSYYDLALKVRQVCPEAVKSDFGKALAFVYADVLQFCHDACVLFNKSPGGKCSVLDNNYNIADSLTGPSITLDPTNTLLSTCFTERFNDLLERLSRHQRLFDVDLRAGRHRSLVNFVRNVTKDLEERQQLMQDPRVLQGMEEEKKTSDCRPSSLPRYHSSICADSKSEIPRKYPELVSTTRVPCGLRRGEEGKKPWLLCLVAVCTCLYFMEG